MKNQKQETLENIKNILAATTYINKDHRGWVILFSGFPGGDGVGAATRND